jgi:protein-L-isoaspartate(D-aspartate) O-methyltransferase
MRFGNRVRLTVAAVISGGAVVAMWSNLFDNSVNPVVPPEPEGIVASPQRDDPLAAARQRMIERHLRHRDINDANVIAAMGRVARERFVPEEMLDLAYGDHPLPIGLGQTISQPYIVALMTQLAKPTPRNRVLEVGVGSGYQAAILAEVCQEVYGIEILPELANAARARLASLGYKNIVVRCGDGYQGWREHAPFDAILVTAAPEHVPQPLVDQLAIGGRLIIPVGRGYQDLLLITKRADGSVDRESVAPVMFVPMTGEAEGK